MNIPVTAEHIERGTPGMPNRCPIAIEARYSLCYTCNQKTRTPIQKAEPYPQPRYAQNGQRPIRHECPSPTYSTCWKATGIAKIAGTSSGSS